ncbi:hypothetical protein Q3G72_018402 [Acer saccharum]|nr:hypothetical protein Q3G72_018402 [Acer saccharum]
MENPSEKFVFSAQPPPMSNMTDSTLGFDSVGSAKRARAESDCLGRNDIVNNTKRTEAMGSFKSKLMNMDYCREGVVTPVPKEPDSSSKGMENSGKEMPVFGPWLLVSYGKQGNNGYKSKNGRSGNSSASAPMTYSSNRKSSVNDPSNSRKAEYAANSVGGKSHHVKNVTRPSNQNLGKPPTSVSSGSRFDVLSEGVDVPMVDSGVQSSKISVEGVKKKGKSVLTEINKTSHNKYVPKPHSQKSKLLAKKGNRLGTDASGCEENRRDADFYKVSVGANSSTPIPDPAPGEPEPKEMDSSVVLRDLHKEVSDFKGMLVDTIGTGDYATNVKNSGLAGENFDVVASNLEEAMAAITEQ